MSEHSPPAALTCAAVLLWLLVFAAFGTNGYTLTSERADTWMFLGWINAIEHGQTPSIDWALADWCFGALSAVAEPAYDLHTPTIGCA